jgi:excisionase family DNA binding protein
MPLLRSSYDQVTLPSEQEMELAQASSRSLSTLIGTSDIFRLQVVDQAEMEVTLPASALRLLVDILTSMAEGKAITIIPINSELTSQQAADLLNVSRKFFIDELLEKGKIAFRKVGRHRRIRFIDLMAYKQENDVKRLQAIDEMVEHDQSLGLY